MKYCTYCGRELLDEAVMCPDCMNLVAQSSVKVKKKKKPINVKKLVIIAVFVGVAFIVAVGSIFGIIILKNNAKVTELQNQLIGNTFEYKNISEDYSDFTVRWISFAEDGRYSLEATDSLFSYELERDEGDYSVKVDFAGNCELYVGDSTFGITVDKNGNIKSISNAGLAYYPFKTVKGNHLALFVDEELAKHELKVNEEAAVEYFYNYFKWNKIEEFEELIPVVFKDYELTVELAQQQNSAYEFIITLSGEYYPHKLEFPNLTKEGKISCRVISNDVEIDLTMTSGSAILDAMNLYSVMSKYSYYY